MDIVPVGFGLTEDYTNSCLHHHLGWGMLVGKENNQPFIRRIMDIRENRDWKISSPETVDRELAYELFALKKKIYRMHGEILQKVLDGTLESAAKEEIMHAYIYSGRSEFYNKEYLYNEENELYRNSLNLPFLDKKNGFIGMIVYFFPNRYLFVPYREIEEYEGPRQLFKQSIWRQKSEIDSNMIRKWICYYREKENLIEPAVQKYALRFMMGKTNV